MISKLREAWLFVLLSLFVTVLGQPAERMVNIKVVPNHDSWVYKTGEKAKVKVMVFVNGSLLDNTEISYSISQDMMSPISEGKKILKSGETELELGTMKTSGFLRCKVQAEVEGRKYEGMATVGFEPEKISPTVNYPDDFLEFWEKAKIEASKEPMNPKMTLIPERCTSKVNVYHVSFGNYSYASRIYGILCVPKAQGKYPAVLKLPGAGVRAYRGEVERAEKGVIILEIGIHGIPVNMEGPVYTNLYMGALRNYHSFNLDDRDRYYYKRVYMGCVRAIDFLYSLPEFDGENLGTFGGSQGGALSIITAALDNRVKGLVSYYPALCDMVGYMHGRAGGWPHFLKDEKNRTPARIYTASYYDVVNFARQIKVPGFYTFGYNDTTCPPTSVYSAYNVIEAPKTLVVAQNTGHYAYPEQTNKAWKWMMDLLKVNNK